MAAIDSINGGSTTGGYLVYSTCSVTVEENEAVVNYALSKRPNVKLVETGLSFGVDGFTRYVAFRTSINGFSFRGNNFHPKMNLTKRYFPHTHNMDGFYVAKFKKFSNKIHTAEDDAKKTVKPAPKPAAKPAPKEDVPAENAQPAPKRKQADTNVSKSNGSKSTPPKKAKVEQPAASQKGQKNRPKPKPAK